MAPKRKAVAETVVSPVKKAVGTRKRKVADAAEVPDEEEEKVKGKGNKSRNTRNNVADLGKFLIFLSN